jgi:hypothetical protein
MVQILSAGEEIAVIIFRDVTDGFGYLDDGVVDAMPTEARFVPEHEIDARLLATG